MSGGSARSSQADIEQNQQDDMSLEKKRLMAQADMDNDVFARKMAQTQAQREADLASGRSRGAEIFKDGALGRLEEGRAREVAGLIQQRQDMQALGNRSGDIADVIDRRKANLAGFTPEEQNAMREENVKTLQQSQGGAMRQLRAQQAQAKVFGPAALAQQQAMASQGQAALTDAERQLFLNQMQAKREALGQFEQSATGAETNEFGRKMSTQEALENSIAQARQEELARQQFNIGQTNKEQFGKLATELGFASLGSAERGSVMQNMLGQKQQESTEKMANAQAGKK